MKSASRIASTIVISAAATFCAFDALAADLVLRFKARLDRAAVPAGHSLADKGLVGSVTTGTVVFSADMAVRYADRQAGNVEVTRIEQAVAKLTLDGAVSATFRGGTATVQDGQIAISDEPVFCQKCSASGALLTTLGGDQGKPSQQAAYKPRLFLLMQPAPHKGKDATLAASIRNLAHFSDKHPVKAMLTFFNTKAREPKNELSQSDLPTLRLIFTLSDVVLGDS